MARTHGLRGTYAHGCRCDPCRAAERRYKASYRRGEPWVGDWKARVRENERDREARTVIEVLAAIEQRLKEGA